MSANIRIIFVIQYLFAKNFRFFHRKARILFHIAHALHEIIHAYGGFGSLGTLVAHLAAATVESVLLGVDSEHAEYHGGVAVGVEGGDALGH